MNLLPKDHSEFDKPEYWEKFFKKRGAKAFEWYGEYPELCGVLHKYIKTQDRVLMVGCGNSQLSADLYDVGYHNIVNIDISDTVIRQMKDKNEQQRPDMKFLKMDVMNLEFPDSEFTVALDKGTLDALMVDESDKVVADVERMFEEVDRVMKLMGRYICISLLQEHILKKVLRVFADKGWALRIHRINTEESGNSEKDFHMPVFALVFTKFKKNPNLPQILEVCTTEGKNERFSSVEALTDVIKEMQYYAVIRQRISKRKVTEDQLSLSLYSEVAATPRYTLTIVDSPSRLTNKFAIFIVPQGREAEWMFSTDAGRQQLAESAGFERLVVVSLDRNHSYQDLAAIQAELSTKVMELAPPTFKQGTKVPFLSIGNDIGERRVVEQGSSEMSGEYVIEDVAGDGGVMFRRLYFLSNRHVVQSEARLKSGKSSKRGKNKKTSSLTVDRTYLACQHHVAMVTGMGLTQDRELKTLLEGDLSVVLIGLGGGGLPTFIHHTFPKVQLDVVDIDPSMVTIATNWFGFQAGGSLKVHVADGIQFIQGHCEKGNRSHVIMLDVDSKEASVGMSCPPQQFVEKSFLATIRQCLHPGGVFVLNLACRDEALKKDVKNTIKDIFPVMFVRDIEDEVNEVVFAINREPAAGIDDVVKTFEHKVKVLNSYLDKTSRSSDSSVDFEEQLEGLKIY